MMARSMRRLALAAVFAICGPVIAEAQDMQAGSVTGLPVPRYVSLKTDRVNLREGPSKEPVSYTHLTLPTTERV